MFSYFKSHIRATTFEIIWESLRAWNKNVGYSSNKLTGRHSANTVFLKRYKIFESTYHTGQQSFSRK